MSSGSASGPDGPGLVRLHGRLWSSRANGPGLRAVVWFQGCTLACRGCFNAASHRAGGGELLAVRDLAEALAARAAGLEGLTVSGGEPFQQPEALHGLLGAVRRAGTLSTLVFTGYRLEEIERRPLGAELLGLIDVLIAGRYLPKLRHGRALVGSANQKVHFLTERYGPADLESVADAELVIDAAGGITVSGISPPMLAPGSDGPDLPGPVGRRVSSTAGH